MLLCVVFVTTSKLEAIVQHQRFHEGSLIEIRFAVSAKILLILNHLPILRPQRKILQNLYSNEKEQKNFENPNQKNSQEVKPLYG
ncbi:CLUMA_CG003912, isoform A [Clunio marinus]|uniref:CLUMA_CG003912, isoform A n=1 Tax=Clunio marinus TaxID=568069 RepID=A0A1J1HUL4_9DIPT|nr:CLUMA_CG003912, isoform A [Clunio marinus]